VFESVLDTQDPLDARVQALLKAAHTHLALAGSMRAAL